MPLRASTVKYELRGEEGEEEVEVEVEDEDEDRSETRDRGEERRKRDQLASKSDNALSTMASLISPLLDGQAILVGMSKDALRQRKVPFKRLLAEGLPADGLSDEAIEEILRRVAAFDANNRVGTCGVGEREGRLFSSLVRRRHWGLAHGIGRSGNLTEIQPKAPGSALLQRLVTRMTTQMLAVIGWRLPPSWRPLLVPMATGMTLALALRALRERRPEGRFVLLSRIDQRSVIKSAALAGLEAIVLPLVSEGDGLVTDLRTLGETIHRLGPERIVAILSTTSCFAPRLPDRILEIAQIAGDIPQLVNNAYGLQSPEATRQLSRALRSGQVLAIVQSMDKNFMVPVGGAIVLGESSLVSTMETLYPGRASMSPLLDLFITLLSMGRTGYRRLLQEREQCYALLLGRLHQFERDHPELIRVLRTPKNDISIAVAITDPINPKGISLGSYLFLRGVSGARLLTKRGRHSGGEGEAPLPASPLASSPVSLQAGTPIPQPGSLSPRNFGMHHDDYPGANAYLTVASALGQHPGEIHAFMRHLSKFFKGKE